MPSLFPPLGPRGRRGRGRGCFVPVRLRRGIITTTSADGEGLLSPVPIHVHGDIGIHVPPLDSCPLESCEIAKTREDTSPEETTSGDMNPEVTNPVDMNWHRAQKALAVPAEVVVIMPRRSRTGTNSRGRRSRPARAKGGKVRAFRASPSCIARAVRILNPTVPTDRSASLDRPGDHHG